MASSLRVPDFEASPPRSLHAPRPVANVPAVIVGADVAALGMARSLGVAGVPVILVDNDATQAGLYSRHVRRFLVSAISGPEFIDDLLALRARLAHRPMLFLRSDKLVRTISQYRERLSEAYQIRLPEHRCVCDLLSKGEFQRIAEREGFPIPPVVRVGEEADFAKLDDFDFPAVVKVCDSGLVDGAEQPSVQFVRSRPQATAVCRAMLAKAPELIVQQWIDGGEDDIYFCLQYRGEGGVTVSSFCGRKLRCWPPATGSTASCTAAPEHEVELERLTSAFFDKTRFAGMCSMEFKRDRCSGRFFMIEPTVGRTDWQEEVAALNGVNIPLAAYCYELGLPLPAIQRPGRPFIWRHPPSYWQSVFVTRSLRDSRPPGARVKSAWWRLDDPVPLALYWLEWVRKLGGKMRKQWRYHEHHTEVASSR